VQILLFFVNYFNRRVTIIHDLHMRYVKFLTVFEKIMGTVQYITSGFFMKSLIFSCTRTLYTVFLKSVYIIRMKDSCTHVIFQVLRFRQSYRVVLRTKTYRRLNYVVFATLYFAVMQINVLNM